MHEQWLYNFIVTIMQSAPTLVVFAYSYSKVINVFLCDLERCEQRTKIQLCSSTDINTVCICVCYMWLGVDRRYSKLDSAKTLPFSVVLKRTRVLKTLHTSEWKVRTNVHPWCRPCNYPVTLSNYQHISDFTLLDSLLSLSPLLYWRCWLAVSLCLSTSPPPKKARSLISMATETLPAVGMRTWHLKLEEEMEREWWQERVTQEQEHLIAMRTSVGF